MDWEDIFDPDEYDKLHLLLLRNVNNCLQLQYDFSIQVTTKVSIEFSEDGKFMAIFYHEDEELEFYFIMNKNIIETLKLVKQRRPTFKFPRSLFRDVKFSKFKFGNRYFVLYGK